MDNEQKIINDHLDKLQRKSLAMSWLKGYTLGIILGIALTVFVTVLYIYMIQ